MRFPAGVALFALLCALCVRCSAAIQQSQTPVASGYADVPEEDARKLVRGCTIPVEVGGPGVSGSVTILRFTVSDKGKLLGIHRVEGTFTHEMSAAFASCHFTPYKVGLLPTAFTSDIRIRVK